MECENGNCVKEKILQNIISSMVEKGLAIFSSFFTSLIIIRFLPRESYGHLGLVVGVFAFINFLNISLESVLLRDHKRFEGKMERVMSSFLFFNIIKSVLLIVLTYSIGYYLQFKYNDHQVMYAFYIQTIILITDVLVSPWALYASCTFSQKVVAKMTFVRALANSLFTLGVILFPTLGFIVIKEFMVSVIYLTAWYFKGIPKLKKTIGESISFSKADFKMVLSTFKEYSLWTHLVGVVTNFIYRSDTFFLSLFTGVKVIGDYNVALNSGNVANIIPSILGYQNSVAVSHCDGEETQKMTSAFLRASIYLGIGTFFLFYIVGESYLELITGESDVNQIYFYLLCIVAGLMIVKTVASPLVALINMKGDVKKLFFFVNLPVLIICAITYYFGAMLFGPVGVAWANIFNSTIWVILVCIQAWKTGYRFKYLFEFKNDVKFVQQAFSRNKL